jgi:hypothetical protein
MRRWTGAAASSISACLLLLTGCAGARFPLCPAIAENSFPSDGRGKIVNMYIQREADARNVEVRPLSEFTAEFRGSGPDLEWFNQNYAFMLCAFDPRKQVYDRETYLSCMSHASQWIQIVRSSTPEDLMLRETKFRENCAPLASSPRAGR